MMDAQIISIGASRRSSSPRILYWSETTAASAFRTGVQRVVLQLKRGLQDLGVDLQDAGWNPSSRLMRIGPTYTDVATALPPECRWLFVPEIPVEVLYSDVDPVQLGRAYGLKTAAIVHDLIPLKLASDYADATVRHYERYFRMFADADLVLATTEHVARDLRAYLASIGRPAPKIAVHPLPAQFADTARRQPPPSDCAGRALRVLAVSTWEPRKNLPRLIRAVRRSEDTIGAGGIALTLVGRRCAWPKLDEEIESLAAAMPNVRLLERVSDRELLDLYADHDISVYPSCEEGFGMPILESLWLGRPCICHNASSMAEVAPGGGTVMIDMTDEAAIADALHRVASDPAMLARLHAEIAQRPLHTWPDYARAVASHFDLALAQ